MASSSNVRCCYPGLVVAVLLLFSTAAFAQFTANIQGIVQDPSGAGIAQATVELRNNATQVSSTTKTDGSGYFPVYNASLARATVKLGQSETLETETGAVLEMGGA